MYAAMSPKKKQECFAVVVSVPMLVPSGLSFAAVASQANYLQGSES